MKYFALIPVLFLLLSGVAESQTTTPQAPGQQKALTGANLKEPLPFDTTIRTGTLSNGLKYYIRHNPKPEKRAELRLAINAGSMQENDDQKGLAHVVEHMAFSGTKNFKKQELVNYLESIGMRFGPDVNAYTSFDETVYMLELPTDTLEILRKGFQILEDWASNILFEDADIARERKVVMEEWRLGRGAGARISDKQFPVLFKNSRYAERLPIGEVKILETFENSQLRKFYQDWYRPDLMAVVAVGDFDTTMIRELIIKHFEGLKNPPNVRPRVLYPVPDHQETLFTMVTDSEATSSGVGIYYKHDTLPQTTHGDYRRQIVNGLHNGMLNTRLVELARQADPPFLYGSVSHGRLVRTKEAFTIGASVKDNGIILGLKTVLREVERAKKFGFSQSELDRVKNDYLRGMESAYNERDKTESPRYASEYIRNFLTGETVPGIEYEYQMYKTYIPEITLEEINALSKTLMPPGNRVVSAIAPEKAGVTMPSEAELRAVIDSAGREELTEYIDTVSAEPLIATPPPPGRITGEKTIASIGVTEWKLSNGIRVVLKPTDFKNDQIQFSSFSPGGSSLAPDSVFIPAVTATSVVEQGGLANFDLITLEKKLSGKIASASPYIDELYEGVSGSSSVKDIETMFQLIHLYFTAPRKDSISFLSYKTRVKSMLENRSASPDAAFQDTVNVTLAQYHPRRMPWTLETLEKMDLQRSMDFYKDRFADADDFTFLFVGNFTLDSIKPHVLHYLGSLPSLPRTEQWRDIGVRRPEGVIAKTVRRGVEPKSEVRLYFTGPFEWNVENRFAINALIDALEIKYHEALRVALGGTYGVSVDGGSTEYPKPSYSLTIGFGCDPARVEEMTNAAMAVIDSVRQFGLPESYVQKVKETQRRGRETGMKQNGFWLSYLQFYYMHNEDPEQILKLEDRLALLTPDFLRDAARRYFNEKNYFKAVLLPRN